ncbi:MAG: hypothetical protein PVG98_11370 [Chromatiales bacterium]|jgi:hypothetical protein
MIPSIDPLSEELLYASPEAPEIARLERLSTDREETGDDRGEA